MIEKGDKIMKMTYIMMSNDCVFGKVYEHPKMGRTIVFESTIKFDDTITIWRMDDDSPTKVSERNVLDFFKDLLPVEIPKEQLQ